MQIRPIRDINFLPIASFSWIAENAGSTHQGYFKRIYPLFFPQFVQCIGKPCMAVDWHLKLKEKENSLRRQQRSICGTFGPILDLSLIASQNHHNYYLKYVRIHKHFYAYFLLDMAVYSAANCK